MIKLSSNTIEELKSITKSLKYVERNVPKAFSAALNRTAQGVRTEGVRKIKGTYQIKYRGLKNEIRITKANPKKLSAILQASGRNIPLIQFKTSPGKPPRKQPKVLKASVKKGKNKAIPGAFVANLGQYQPGVFIRTGPGRRAPVEELFGPGIPVMLGEPGVVEHMRKEADRRMAGRLDHEMKRVLGRMK
ncbi:hypothetical protein BVG16_16365 [Paenibacillus selenitireducens]|uniref:Phage tail protein n=1 Tax=Paenibacillus selenitireducens TaxID=1324314 RepID=A0A1T2XA13_9BACL|nr:phage tail protein [Paenibacillus selenitireducens]OPA76744.1 hypothetical protein BVG16_16365 [Paenibacillus selenitireducens]